MELKIKDFANLQGVSESIVYRHIRQHKEDLGDRVVKRGNATWLTDEGQLYIKNLMVQQPIAVSDGGQQREIEKLREQVSDLQDRLIFTQEKLLNAQEVLAEGQTARLQLAASVQENERLHIRLDSCEAEIDLAKKEKEKVEQELEQLRMELDTERNRPLTIRERFFGRRK